MHGKGKQQSITHERRAKFTYRQCVLKSRQQKCLSLIVSYKYVIKCFHSQAWKFSDIYNKSNMMAINTPVGLHYWLFHSWGAVLSTESCGQLNLKLMKAKVERFIFITISFLNIWTNTNSNLLEHKTIILKHIFDGIKNSPGVLIPW